MKLIDSIAAMRSLPRPLGSEGEGPGARAVVMTMGALHEGHLSLVRHARTLADQVVVTIYVNPLQFDEKDDYESYPRDLDADLAMLEGEGVDAVFAPSDAVMYPLGQPVVSVSAGRVGQVFEGAARPGHFDGVLTVVAKLMSIVQPDVAVFGAKDAQQVIAVRALVRDLNLPVRIEPAPTVRDEDGLASSSRNVFLSASQRADALALVRSLRAAEQSAASGAALPKVLAAAREVLDAADGIEVDYCEALGPYDASTPADDFAGEVVIAVAGRVGETRLIDNATVRIG